MSISMVKMFVHDPRPVSTRSPVSHIVCYLLYDDPVRRLTVGLDQLQETGGRTNPKKPKPDREPRERKNTAIYITNLPTSPPTTSEELQHVFSRCGVIAEEIDRGKPRIKLYTNEDGSCKGDALIVYFRAESVDLAIQMLDDSELRLGAGEPRMKVVAADFSYKKVQQQGEDGAANGAGAGAAPGGNHGKDRKMGDKQKIIKKTQKLNRYAESRRFLCLRIHRILPLPLSSIHLHTRRISCLQTSPSLLPKL